MKKLPVFAACMLSAAVLAQPVSAKVVSSSTTVAIGDLDLASAEGQKILDRRLRAAVRKVCGPLNVRVIAEQMQYQECTKSSRTEAETAKRAAIENTKKASLATSMKRSGPRS